MNELCMHMRTQQLRANTDVWLAENPSADDCQLSTHCAHAWPIMTYTKATNTNTQLQVRESNYQLDDNQ